MSLDICEVKGCRRSAYFVARTYSKNLKIKVCTEHAEQMRQAGWTVERIPPVERTQPVERIQPDAIQSFRGEFQFLSNFYPAVIEYEGLVYPSVGHAFQAAQTLEPKEREPFTRSTVAASSAKRMGRNVNLRPDWEAIKVKIMADLIAIKFSNPELRELLLETGERELIESNRNDRFWGVSEGKGQNQLGRILMEARAAIRAAESQ